MPWILRTNAFLATTTHGRGVGDMPGRWNDRWQAFIDANPNATATDVFQCGGRLMDEYGLSGLPIVPFPR
jgi:hypothetical protein